MRCWPPDIVPASWLAEVLLEDREQPEDELLSTSTAVLVGVVRCAEEQVVVDREVLEHEALRRDEGHAGAR